MRARLLLLFAMFLDKWAERHDRNAERAQQKAVFAVLNSSPRWISQRLEGHALWFTARARVYRAKATELRGFVKEYEAR